MSIISFFYQDVNRDFGEVHVDVNLGTGFYVKYARSWIFQIYKYFHSSFSNMDIKSSALLSAFSSFDSSLASCLACRSPVSGSSVIPGRAVCSGVSCCSCSVS